MNNMKRLIERFRAWQQEPLHYESKSRGTMRCKNCGTEFDANFCPMCGQKANVGRVGWDTVRQGILLVWGMDSRSSCMPYSTSQMPAFSPQHTISANGDAKIHPLCRRDIGRTVTFRLRNSIVICRRAPRYEGMP